MFKTKAEAEAFDVAFRDNYVGGEGLKSYVTEYDDNEWIVVYDVTTRNSMYAVELRSYPMDDVITNLVHTMNDRFAPEHLFTFSKQLNDFARKYVKGELYE